HCWLWQQVSTRPGFIRPVEANRQERNFCSPCQCQESGLECSHFAVAGPSPFGEDEEHLSILKSPQAFFQTSQTASFAIDRNGIERHHQPRKGRESKQCVACHVVQAAVKR